MFFIKCSMIRVFFRAFRGGKFPPKFPTPPLIIYNIQAQKQHFVINKIAQDPLGVAAIQYIIMFCDSDLIPQQIHFTPKITISPPNSNF